MEQRVALARALIQQPRILLLDEPMAGMNVEEKEDMSRFILDVNDEFGTTIALIEHDMGVVFDLADRISVLVYGEVIASDTPQRIKANAEGIKAQLSHFLDFGSDRALMLNNADWLADLNYIEFLREIGRHFSVNRMLSFETYKMRLDTGLSFIEFNYQLLQAYDYLVLAAGVRTNYFGNSDWVTLAPGLKTIDEAVDVRGRFLLAFEQAELEGDPEARQAVLTFAIVGAGPTGVEMAGAMAEISRQTLRRDYRHFDTQSARVLLIDFADRVLLAPITVVVVVMLTTEGLIFSASGARLSGRACALSACTSTKARASAPSTSARIIAGTGVGVDRDTALGCMRRLLKSRVSPP